MNDDQGRLLAFCQLHEKAAHGGYSYNDFFGFGYGYKGMGDLYLGWIGVVSPEGEGERGEGGGEGERGEEKRERWFIYQALQNEDIGEYIHFLELLLCWF